MNGNLLAHLQFPYRRDTWLTLLRDLVGESLSLLQSPQEIQLDHANIGAVHQVGAMELADGKRIALFEVAVSDQTELARNRVALRNAIARFIDQAHTHAVLVAFHQPGRQDWRLTFAARAVEIDDDTFEITTRETAPKRFTFLLGPGEPCRTAAERLGELAGKAGRLTLQDVEKAFSVERLNKEFFHHYKEHYQRFVDHLVDRTDAPEKIFRVTAPRDSDHFDDACKPVRDFVKRLLGRIVFLHFLQRKRWLGCHPKRKDWQDGDREFLQHYFDLAAEKSGTARFHSRWLTPLFFDALNNPDRPRDVFEPTGTRVPYLNGGLFEEVLPAARAIDFPPEFFRALLEFFGQYNFTIDENDPEENEIGIDPEMLGHIFENLIEDNKGKGVFYTPKAIVQYMSQQALLHYLRTHLGKHEALDQLVLEKDPGDRADSRSWMRQHGERIEQLIDGCKICDPAVGSGAFPIGMLNEMLQIKLALDLTLDPHEAKKALIQNCLHGVDLDPGAIEIARLRFWLALVVDAKSPEPLPNLDYKLYRADSLIERLRGEPVNIGAKPPDNPRTRAEIQKLVEAKRRLYDAHTKPEKRNARHDLYAALGSLAQIELTHLRNESDFTDDDFGRIVAALDELGRLVGRLESVKNAKVAERERALDAIQEWFEDRDHPTFLWQLHFGEIFAARPAQAALDGGLNLGDTLAASEPGGFDIVIENPPYVRQESIKDIKPLLKHIYECYTGTADLFVYFYERSSELLRTGGALSIITSNKYYRSGYGKNLRGYLTGKFALHTLIDFGDAPVFDAIAYASILVGTKNAPSKDHAVRVHTWQPGDQLSLIVRIVEEKGFELPQSKLTADGWRLESAEVHALLEKLRNRGKPLGEYVNGRFYYGIKTGLNEAFVIDEATKNRLIAEDPKSAEVIKPFLRGKDVKRWLIKQEKWLLFIPWHFPRHKDRSGNHTFDQNEAAFRRKYPAIFRHLAQHAAKLAQRNSAETGVRYEWYCLQRWGANYHEEFEHPKIVYPDIYEHQSFAFAPAGTYLTNTTYFIPTRENWLCSYLNSLTAEWFYSQISNRVRGGYLRSFSDYMKDVPIPFAAPADKAKLAELAEACQLAVKSGDTARLQTLEAEINQIVYRLFDLTEEEIRLIEESTAK